MADRMLFHLERFVYKKASCVTVIAPRMCERLLEKGVPREKVKVIPNFIDIDDISPLPKDNEFSRLYKVHDKFVVNYAGTWDRPRGWKVSLRLLSCYEMSLAFAS